MKIAILLCVTLTCSCLAASEKPSALQIREYRLPPGFLPWIERASRPREAAAAAEPKAPHMEVCGSLFGAWAEGVFPRGTSASYHPASNSLIVRGTTPFLNAFDKLVAQCRTMGLKSQPNPKLINALKDQARKDEALSSKH